MTRTAGQEGDDVALEEMMRLFYNSPPTVAGTVWPTLAQALRFAFAYGKAYGLSLRGCCEEGKDAKA